ncbi:MAG: lytic transglycosylase domain-containing protein [Deltaproteobacteria bacterium]|nr:lytic transglycosylase domain-containing protein [Deltaproteobacteria bacterium]
MMGLLLWLGLASASDLPTDPAALSAMVVRVEAEIRAGQPSGQLQQRLYRRLADDPALAAAVVPGLPDAVRPAVTLGLSAVRGHASIVKAPRADLPPWTLVEPPPPDELLGYYRAAEARHGVSWSVLAAIHLVETRMGRIRATSTAGALGPMQFMPATWAAYGEGDVTDPRDAIHGAANYLAKSGAARDLDRAIWAYNHHDGYVRAVRDFAAVMEAEPTTYLGFHGWEASYRTVRGWMFLPVGYASQARLPLDVFCAAHGPPWCPG